MFGYVTGFVFHFSGYSTYSQCITSRRWPLHNSTINATTKISGTTHTLNRNPIFDYNYSITDNGKRVTTSDTPPEQA